jgi:hypothetical protein
VADPSEVGFENAESYSAGFSTLLLAVIRLPSADGQLETSQVPVQATVSSEFVKIQTNGPLECIIHLDVAARRVSKDDPRLREAPEILILGVASQIDGGAKLYRAELNT